MHVKTYRARTMQQALELVRRDLGPDAAVLHTREVRGRRKFPLMRGEKQIEVTASADVSVPSRLPQRPAAQSVAATVAHGPIARESSAGPDENRGTSSPVYPRPRPPAASRLRVPPAEVISSLELDRLDQSPYHREMKDQLAQLHAKMEDLCRRSRSAGHRDLPETLFQLFTDLIEAEVNEDLARELVERLRPLAQGEQQDDLILLKARVLRMIEEEIQVTGPIRVTAGQRHIVALVGPTGVGKTTTIAKLAANYRLRQKLRVGLITVDTYRIAAVEQLRTYADIIELPMEVVSMPRDMRQAVDRLADMDLILMDTAGRSPRDEVRIQELKAFLSEADCNEVHLVLSSVASASGLCKTAEQFAPVGTTALLMTKLDEAGGLGNLPAVMRGSKLPLSYVTNGQNVPDDIEVADPRRLARIVLGMEES